MTNPGIAPPDFTTPVGQFRLLAQDTNFVDLIPTVDGQGGFDLFSDAEIAGYLAMYTGYSLYRAVGSAYQALAARASMVAKMVKDYDLQVDLTKRSTALQETANAMFERAEKEDLLTGAVSTFDLTAPVEDISREINFEIPFSWGLSPFQVAQAENSAGFMWELEVADIGEGENGEGIVVTDGTATPAH
jgi:hypothetical protein